MTVQQDAETVRQAHGHAMTALTVDDLSAMQRNEIVLGDALDRLAALAEQADTLTNERDMLKMSHDEGNEILGEIVCQIETVSPDDPTATCKCGPCRHHRGVTRLCLLAEQAEKILDDGAVSDVQTLVDRIYRALEHNRGCSCGQCSGGKNAVDSLATLAEQAEAYKRERDKALEANESAKQFSYASHRRRAEAAEAQAERLRNALLDRVPSGHNDTCQSVLETAEAWPCNCGHDSLVAALAAVPPTERQEP